MTAGSFEHASEVRAALQAIVSDPALGASALDTAQMLANLLGDLLPGAPREAQLLVAASAAGLPQMLRGHAGQGMDAVTAITLAAAALAGRTAFTTGACQWAAREVAIALGLDSADRLVPAASRDLTEIDAAAGPGQVTAAGQRTRSRQPEPGPRARTLPPQARPASRRGPVLAVGLAVAVAVVVVAVVLTRSPGSHRPPRANAPVSLAARRPPGGGYTVSLPASWKFRNASYPSDHATHLWYDPANPLEKMQVVLSGCVGCADQHLNQAVPDPGQLVPPGAVGRALVSRWEERFRTYTSDDPYPDDGEVIVLQSAGQVSGYCEVQLWLPASRHAQAAAILRSFFVPPADGGPGLAASPAVSPRAVVQAYIAAINQRDWPRVWQLGGKNLGPSYSQMIAGYQDTKEVVIITMTVRGEVVSVRVRAPETTGPVQTYLLRYVVSGGTIIAGQQTLLGTSG